ncbi:pentatricopeptide repeat-containing protein At1g62350 [Musa acuminata AAA Group]|uniref:pentatricopeptide repeat-containing protein At1g62350 n=1 Tax=Musa acuminata AAA Group TaxID=214697 RepID=UPI0031D9EEE0
MASSSTGSALRFRNLRPLLALERGSPTSLRGPSRIRCGLRGERKPLWRGRVMSTEAIQAVQALKLANSSSSSRRIEGVLDARVGRLLKADQIAVLAELRRQNEWQLALQVFAFIRKEVWYKPELSLYSDMIFMLGKNKLIGLAEELFSELQKEGLQPDTRACTEMIGAFLQVDMVEKAMDVYKSMKELGCSPDKLTLTILIRNLEKVGLEDLASDVRKDCAEYMDFPEKFLKEVDKKFPKRRSLKLV